MKIRDVLAAKGSRVVTVWPNKPLDEIVRLLAERNIASVVVVDHDDHPLGVITDRIIMRELAHGGAASLRNTARAVLMKQTEPVLPACSVEDTVAAVLRRMTDERYRHAVIMDESRLVGIVSIGDLVKVRLDDAEIEGRVLRDIALGHMAAA
ncbi:MAG: CBS domain-containing protein [Hyphomicrobium sp.]